MVHQHRGLGRLLSPDLSSCAVFGERACAFIMLIVNSGIFPALLHDEVWPWLSKANNCIFEYEHHQGPLDRNFDQKRKGRKDTDQERTSFGCIRECQM